MRRNLRPILAFALAVTLTSEAHAVTLRMSGTLSILQPVAIIGVGVVPVVFAQSPDPVLVSVTGGAFDPPAGLFSGTFVPPTPPLTGGIGPNTTLQSVIVSAGPGNFAPLAGPGGGFGGTQRVGGRVIWDILGGIIDFTIPLQQAGVGGTQQGGAASLMVTVTGAGWTTGAAAVTGITTTIVSTVGGAVGPAIIVGNRQYVTTGFYLLTNTAVDLSLANTATLSGSDARTPGGLGILTLVTPIRVLTNAGGNFPLFAVQTLEFTAVPEPGTALLVGSGLACLAIGARRRMRES